MQNIKTVFIVPPDDYGVYRAFESRGYIVMNDIQKADALVFTGGADINPALYGETPLPRTTFRKDRDAWEIKAFEVGKERDVPMLGICRGAQLLNVLAGGKLWQHVDGHGNGNHEVTLLASDGSGKVVGKGRTTSCHHQMMRPTKEGIVLGFTRISKLKLAINEHITDMTDDVEIVYYPKDKLYCFQGHPEWDLTDTSDLFFGHINELFG